MFDPAQWRVSVELKGFEREPLLVIDGFATEPLKLIDEAAGLVFRALPPYYPGLRAAMPDGSVRALATALAPLCVEVFGAAPAVEACLYSLVTTPPDRLAPIQRLPHYDGTEPERLAFILYLCDPHQGGTSFYRHRSTGYETVSGERFPAYRDALAADARTHGLPPARYIAGDTPLFERLPGPGAAFNRALVYRGRNLHSGDIGADFRFDPNPRTGRLTLTAFFAGSS